MRSSRSDLPGGGSSATCKRDHDFSRRKGPRAGCCGWGIPSCALCLLALLELLFRNLLDLLEPLFRKLPSWEASRPGHCVCIFLMRLPIPIPAHLVSVVHSPLLHLFSTWLTSLCGLRLYLASPVAYKTGSSSQARMNPLRVSQIQFITVPALPRAPGKELDRYNSHKRCMESFFCLELI